MQGSRASVQSYRARLSDLVDAAAASRAATVRDLDQSGGLILAARYHSPEAQPGADNSSMDGYALSAIAPGTSLRVSGVIAAGSHADVPLVAGTARKVMTGAPVPSGTVAVVPVERVGIPRGANPDVIVVPPDIHPGDFIRLAGSDLAEGELIAAPGTRISPRMAGVLAGAGFERVQVLDALRVGIVTTGSEVVRGPGPVRRGEIRNSNGPILRELVRATGARVVAEAHASDEPGSLAAVLDGFVDTVDVVITCGGISQGDFEPVRELLTAAEHSGSFAPIAMQPGGPQGNALYRGMLVVALPGNPVSVLVSFEILLRNALRKVAGLAPIEPEWMPLGAAVTGLPTKDQFRRALRGPDGTAIALPGASSHLLHSASTATHLLEVPAGVGALKPGTPVAMWPLTP